MVFRSYLENLPRRAFSSWPFITGSPGFPANSHEVSIQGSLTMQKKEASRSRQLGLRIFCTVSVGQAHDKISQGLASLQSKRSVASIDGLIMLRNHQWYIWGNFFIDSRERNFNCRLQFINGITSSEPRD